MLFRSVVILIIDMRQETTIISGHSLPVYPQSVRVVREYPDVFDEVRGLPPKREIDFRIYLVDNAKPVSLPVRHMAPRERRELSKQVKELLENNFIRRSISEWGAPVVFATKADDSLRLCVDY